MYQQSANQIGSRQLIHHASNSFAIFRCHSKVWHSKSLKSIVSGLEVSLLKLIDKFRIRIGLLVTGEVNLPMPRYFFACMDTGTSIVVMTVIRFPSISDYNIDAQVLSPRYQRSDVWVISDISMLKPSVQLLLIVVQAFPARKEGGEGRLTAASKMNAFTDLIYHAYGYTSTPTSFSLACSKRDIKRERVSRSLGIFVNCPNLGSGVPT